MMNLNGGYVMLDLNAKGLYAKAEALIGIDKPILLYPLNNGTPYYINKIAKVTEGGVTYINVNDEYKIASDGTITPIEPEPQSLPIATASVLGGVKIGSGINVTEDGTISTTPPTEKHLYKHRISLNYEEGDSDNYVNVYIDIYNDSNDPLTASDLNGVYECYNQPNEMNQNMGSDMLFYSIVFNNAQLNAYGYDGNLNNISSSGSYSITDTITQIF